MEIGIYPEVPPSLGFAEELQWNCDSSQSCVDLLIVADADVAKSAMRRAKKSHNFLNTSDVQI